VGDVRGYTGDPVYLGSPTHQCYLTFGVLGREVRACACLASALPPTYTPSSPYLVELGCELSALSLARLVPYT
jgi:hypothetical protein